MQNESIRITVENSINAPIEKVWECWTLPKHIIHWNHASDEWHTPAAENDLCVGGKFLYRMESKDGTMGFDFNGIYDFIRINMQITYTIEGGRKVNIIFTTNGETTTVKETFDAETENSVELQQSGWQAILDNFKKYTESN